MKTMIEEAAERDLKTEKTNKKELEDKIITVYGDVELSENKRTLGPTFPLMEDLEESITDQDFLMATTKVRWQRMGMETPEILRWKEEDEVQEEEKQVAGAGFGGPLCTAYGV